MMGKRGLNFLVLSLLSLVLLDPVPAWASSPTEQVRTSVEKVLAILQDPRLKAEARKNERRDRLREAISERFDFVEMARRSLAAQWRRLSPKEREEFVRLFTDLLERSYLDRIESYNDEKFIYLKENLDGNYAEVHSRIVTQGGEEFSLNYRVHLVGGEWKVYDVVVENISLVNNYRSQFNRVIANSSYSELLRRMKERQIEVQRK